MNEHRFRGRVFDVKAGATACVLIAAAVALALVPSRSFSATADRTADPVIAAAGDIACDPVDPDFNGGSGTPSRCRQQATATLLEGATAVLPLGDNQYEDGTLSAYQQSYGLSSSWGSYNDVAYPVPGNHEYNTLDAADYFAYFGAAAGDPALGYYSFDLGSWHLVALNSERGTGSVQTEWLRADLSATTKPCILAYWHAPRFSSGNHGNDLDSDAFWHELYNAHADVVLNGHDHHYERFALQNPLGVADPEGIREFVVGTGGKSHAGFPTVQPNSEVRDSSTYGVLRLTLQSYAYHWQFVAEEGETFTDTGTTSCHGAPPTAVKTSACRAGFWAAGRGGRLRYVCLRRWRPV